MNINVNRSTGQVKVEFIDENTTIKFGWMLADSKSAVELANMLRAAADEIQLGDCVPYEDLLFAYNQEREAD
ncbi:hypothetical protein [Burkholderia glumae]|uniref:hypothetical protein n=1 Tax=Burkholderia glumae TaxID=337 RepID=UPI00215161D2|nr:hypothetical protein [Burkholderia glumae]